MNVDNELFRFIRVSKRLSQRDFAKMIGYSHGLVSHIETGLLPVSDGVSRAVIGAFNLTSEEISKYKELLNITV